MKLLRTFLVACVVAPLIVSAQTMHVSGRTYRYHLSADRNPYRSPLVVALTGTEMSAARFEQISRLDREADDEGFVVIYPEPRPGGWNRHEDVAYVTQAMRDAVHRWFLDWHRIYVVGFSNGGVLAYSLAQDLAPRLAGVACVAANMPSDMRDGEPQVGVSMLIVNGTRDPLMPFAGGAVSPRLGGGQVLSTRDTVQHWVNADECDAGHPATPLTTQIVQDTMQVEVQHWNGGRDGSEVASYRIEGAGHTWPGAELDLPLALIGPQCHEIDAADTVWQFLKPHQRALSTD